MITKHRAVRRGRVWHLLCAVFAMALGCSASTPAGEVKTGGDAPVVVEPSFSDANAIANLLPADVALMVEVNDPSQVGRLVDEVAAVAPAGTPFLTRREWVDIIASSLDVGASDASDLIDDVERAALAVRVPTGRSNLDAELVLLGRMARATAVEKLLKVASFEPVDSWSDQVKVYRLSGNWSEMLDGKLTDPDNRIVLAWSDPIVAIGSEAMVREIVPQNKRQHLVDTPAYRQAQTAFIDGALVNAFGDPQRAEGLSSAFESMGFAPGKSVAALSLRIDDAGVALRWMAGVHVPPIVGRLMPRAQSLALGETLPASTIAYAGVSTDLRPGAAEELAELGRQNVPELDQLAASLERGANLRPVDVLKSLGSQAVVGVSMPDTHGEPTDGQTPTVIGIITTKGDKETKSLLKAIEQLSRDVGMTPKRTQRGFELALPGSRVAAFWSDDRGIVGAAGPTVEVTALMNSKGPKLGDDAAYRRSVGTLPGQSQSRMWVDIGRLQEIIDDPSLREALGAVPSGVSGAASLSIEVEGEELTYRFDSHNVAGALLSVAVSGARRYLSTAKSSEAKNTVGAIARSALAAYERESLSAPMHRLCQSAPPVPKIVPAGEKYQPVADDGRDFVTGTQERGWRCLKFEVSSPQYYQYEYRAMQKDYKGPARGGPDPGPNGFEVSAEGDLDGDGKTSLFTIVGQVVDGQVKVSPMFVDDEFE